MGLLDKKIDCKSYHHCLNCAIYRQQVNRIATKYPPHTILDLHKITPNCMWYIEHILNGDQKNTENCIWYQNSFLPVPPIQ